MTQLNTVQALLEAPAARTPMEAKSIRPFRAKVSDEAGAGRFKSLRRTS